MHYVNVIQLKIHRLHLLYAFLIVSFHLGIWMPLHESLFQVEGKYG